RRIADRGCAEPAQPARHQERRRRRHHPGWCGNRVGDRRSDRPAGRGDAASGHAAASQSNASHNRGRSRMTGPLLTLLNAPMLTAYTAAGHWGSETLYMIAARHAKEAPDRWAVRDRHCRLTYGGLVESADRLAGHLAGRGLRTGERVAA